MGKDIFAFKRNAPGMGWDPVLSRHFKIRLREVQGMGNSGFGPFEAEFIDAALQFWDTYVAVVLKSGEVHVFPYVIIADIVVMPALDTSDAARDAAVAAYKMTLAGGADAKSDVPAPTGAAES